MTFLALFLGLSLISATCIHAQIAAYGQCGGSSWCLNTDCQPGYTCTINNAYYSQCVPAPVPSGHLDPYVQCGGTITTPCSPGYACITSNGYSMCTPIVHTALTTVNTCLVPATSTLLTVKSSIASNSSLKFSSSSTRGSSMLSTSIKTPSPITLSSKMSTKLLSSNTKTSSALSSQLSLLPINISSTLQKISSSSTNTFPSNAVSSPAILVPTSTIASIQAQQTPYGQCGGIGWTGLATCTSGWTCILQAGNPYYSQCLPGSNSPPLTSTPPSVWSSTSSKISSLKPSTTLTTSTQVSLVGSCTPSPRSCAVTYPPPSCAGKVKFAGINIAGCDFGTDTDGNQSPSGAYCPIGQYNPDGPGQMLHFAFEKFNIFRLPTGWQYIVNSGSPTATLDPTNWRNFRNLVQACLNTGAHCVIDIHNYARFNGAIIGQGGPSNAIFAQLWANIATVYASNPKVMFGIMNEPHDVNIATWAQTVQVVVTAIRNAGATSQMILLPGYNWTGAGTFISSGSGPALAAITNLDGSTTNLIFDVHKYLDWDGSGSNAICVGDQISSSFAPLAQWLRCNGRQAILSETGGSSDTSCLGYMCSAISFLNANSDVYLGYIGWAAGSFTTGYTLAMTPANNNGIWTDTSIVSRCLVPH